MTPEQQAEHRERMQRISDKTFAATGSRPDALAAGYRAAQALERVLDTLLEMQAEEEASDD